MEQSGWPYGCSWHEEVINSRLLFRICHVAMAIRFLGRARSLTSCVHLTAFTPNGKTSLFELK